MILLLVCVDSLRCAGTAFCIDDWGRHLVVFFEHLHFRFALCFTSLPGFTPTRLLQLVVTGIVVTSIRASSSTNAFMLMSDLVPVPFIAKAVLLQR